ncbi:MAG: diguanylate cyclase, partial [Gallionella sp.]
NSIAAPFYLQGKEVNIGASVGIARYPDDAEIEAGLLIVADKAMYAAKAAGKNTYQFGTPIGDTTATFLGLDHK